MLYIVQSGQTTDFPQFEDSAREYNRMGAKYRLLSKLE